MTNEEMCEILDTAGEGGCNEVGGMNENYQEGGEMIIVRQNGSIVNFDNVTDIDIFDKNGTWKVFASFPYIYGDECAYVVLGEYGTVEQAKEQIEFMVCAFQRDKKVYIMTIS